MIRCRSNYSAVGHWLFDDDAPPVRLALDAFDGEVDLRGLARDSVPVEVGGEPFAGGDRSLLCGIGIVQHGAHCRGHPCDVAWWVRHPGLPVDDRLTEAADGGGD